MLMGRNLQPLSHINYQKQFLSHVFVGVFCKLCDNRILHFCPLVSPLIEVRYGHMDKTRRSVCGQLLSCRLDCSPVVWTFWTIENTWGAIFGASSLCQIAHKKIQTSCCLYFQKQQPKIQRMVLLHTKNGLYINTRLIWDKGWGYPKGTETFRLV